MSTWLLELLFALMVFAADIVFADVSSVIVGMHETWVLLGMCKCHHSLFAFGLPSLVFLTCYHHYYNFSYHLSLFWVSCCVSRVKKMRTRRKHTLVGALLCLKSCSVLSNKLLSLHIG